MLAKHLNAFAESPNLFSSQQFGFHKGLGAALTITDMVQTSLDPLAAVESNVDLDKSSLMRKNDDDRGNNVEINKGLIFKGKNLPVVCRRVAGEITDMHAVSCRTIEAWNLMTEGSETAAILDTLYKNANSVYAGMGWEVLWPRLKYNYDYHTTDKPLP